MQPLQALLLRHRFLLILLTALSAVAALGGCASGHDAKKIMLIGPDKILAASVPIDTYFYNHEQVLDDVLVKTSNKYSANCHRPNQAVAADEVGKVRTGGYVCGQLIMPTHAFDATAVTIKWRVNPYPDWQVQRTPDGEVVSPVQETTILSYIEENTVTVALPPYEKICSLSIHFMGCNQVYVDTGCQEKRTYDSLIEDLTRFRRSQAMCMARPTVGSDQDHDRHRTTMSAAKAERQDMTQRFLPYRKQAKQGF